jgi:hypothetical protein
MMILCKAASLQPTEMLTGTSGIIEGNSRAAQERVYGLGRSAPSISINHTNPKQKLARSFSSH